MPSIPSLMAFSFLIAHPLGAFGLENTFSSTIELHTRQIECHDNTLPCPDFLYYLSDFDALDSTKSLEISQAFGLPFPSPSSVPNIDTCGRDSTNNTTCPGAGRDNYFYRCCSSAGHCGPKNDLQDQDVYCGSGCQAGFGNCDKGRSIPARPSASPGLADKGETCGPIVNRRCSSGLCCSGSNYCGVGVDFCGAANWCQAAYGICN